MRIRIQCVLLELLYSRFHTIRVSLKQYSEGGWPKQELRYVYWDPSSSYTIVYRHTVNSEKTVEPSTHKRKLYTYSFYTVCFEICMRDLRKDDSSL